MAAEELRHKLFSGEDPRELLWDAVVACQNQTFYTTSGLPFSYTVRRKKDGGYSGELLVSRKEGSKTLTRSSVQLALERVARDYAAAGEPPYYSGPKAIGQLFGISYIYSLFWRWGLIRVPEKASRNMGGG